MQAEEREPLDISFKSFIIQIRESDWVGASPSDLKKPLTWEEIRLIISAVRTLEATIGNDYLARYMVEDQEKSAMNTIQQWMWPKGWPTSGTLPGGAGTHGGQATVNMLYRMARLYNLIGIVLWHRNRYKPILHPVVGYKIVGNHRFHESYEPTEEDLKRVWWR